MNALKGKLSGAAANVKSDISLKTEQMKLDRQQQSLAKMQSKQEEQQKKIAEQQKKTQEKLAEQKTRQRESVLKQMEPLFSQLLDKLKSQLEWQSKATANLKTSVKPDSSHAAAVTRADDNVNKLLSELKVFKEKSTSTKADEFANLGTMIESVLASNTSVNNILKSIQVPLQEQKSDLDKQISVTVAAMKQVENQIKEATSKLKDATAISETRGKLLTLKQKL